MKNMGIRTVTGVTLVSALLFSGCSSLSQSQEGALIGAGAGAALGALIGNATGNTTAGLLIGAAVGGAAGGLIAAEMDEKAEELADDLGDDATVERIGEGIAVTFSSGILFDTNSADLKPEAQTSLTELARSLRDDPNSEIVVVGHTDDTGEADYNLALSQRRAQSAANYLIGQGMAPQRVRTQGLGETDPAVEGTTPEARAANRRVEVAIFATEEYREEMVRQHGGGGQ
jgi:outer membrane protein OmpA-like peptidoglycan-associated protein